MNLAERIVKIDEYLSLNETKNDRGVILGFNNYIATKLTGTKLERFINEDFMKLINYLEDRADFIKLKPFAYFTDAEAELLAILANDYMSQYKVNVMFTYSNN